MEFYKEGKIVELSAGVRQDLGAAQYNHKAALLLWNGTSAKIEFYTKGTVSLGITYATGSADYTTGSNIPSSLYKSIIPVRLAGVTPDTVGTKGRLILLN